MMTSPSSCGPQSPATIKLLVTLVDDREPGYARHANSVARFARMVGLQLGLDEASLENLHLAALLHDVGSLRLPFAHRGSRWHLPPEERRVYEGHPGSGARIVRMLGLPSDVEHAVLGHHERWDGTGYPRGLTGARTPLPARILGVCDVFDGLVSGWAEPDLSGISEEEALARMRESEAERYDQSVVAALAQAMQDEREFGALTGLIA